MRELHVQIGWETDHYFADILEPQDCAACFPRPAHGFPCRLKEGALPLAEAHSQLFTLAPETNLGALNGLSDALFAFLCRNEDGPNALHDFLSRCIEEARQGNLREGVRLALHLDPERPELLGAPWELMREPKTGKYLTLFDTPPLTLLRASWTRAIGFGAQQPVPVKDGEPLRVLIVLGPNEEEAARIRAFEEALDIDLALCYRLPWQVDLHILRQPDIAEMKAWCTRWRPHIFHFVGHGIFLDGEPRLLLQPTGRDSAEPAELTGSTVGDLFAAGLPHLVILNACRSGQEKRQGDALKSSVMAARGFSELLIRRGVPAVIAMQADIEGEAAALLMKEFYAMLAAGKPVDVALFHARQAVRLNETWTNYWDWALPALYVAANGRMADLLCLQSDPADARPRILGDATTGQSDRLTDMKLEEAIRLQVGYGRKRLDLEEDFLGEGGTDGCIILLLTGEESAGKTSLVYWLVESRARRGRLFLYADFADMPVEYWDALRLIRDGALAMPGYQGVRLDNQIKPDVAFNRFNYILNCKLDKDYESSHPVPTGVKALAETQPGANLTAALVTNAAVPTGEDPLIAISDVFWADLKRLAKRNSLVVFLDHVDRMTNPVVESLQKHLFQRALAEPESRVRFVIIHTISGQTPGVYDPWMKVLEESGSSVKIGQFSLEGFPSSQIKWMAKRWARRYFLHLRPLSIRMYKRRHPNLVFKATALDRFVDEEDHLNSAEAMPPGVIVQFLTNLFVVNKMLNHLTEE